MWLRVKERNSEPRVCGGLCRSIAVLLRKDLPESLSKKKVGIGGVGQWRRMERKGNRFGENTLIIITSQMLFKIFFLLWKYCGVVERTLD